MQLQGVSEQLAVQYIFTSVRISNSY